jgi:predicted lipoprotein with Yx(FWY)xxD motif
VNMTRRRPITFFAGAALVALTALSAGCGSSGGGATAATPPKTASGQTATIGLASTGLGQILVDSQARTLYLFKKDSGTTSACSGECASAWPPLVVNGMPTVGAGANSSLVGTTKRSDGTTQVTYSGHPLYRFVKDQKPGETNGQGVSAFGASWFALTAAGTQASGQASTSGGGSSGY